MQEYSVYSSIYDFNDRKLMHKACICIYWTSLYRYRIIVFSLNWAVKTVSSLRLLINRPSIPHTFNLYWMMRGWAINDPSLGLLLQKSIDKLRSLFKLNKRGWIHHNSSYSMRTEIVSVRRTIFSKQD